jgi:hypothetical protein
VSNFIELTTKTKINFNTAMQWCKQNVEYATGAMCTSRTLRKKVTFGENAEDEPVLMVFP